MPSPITLSARPPAAIDAPLRRDTVLVVAGRARQRARFARLAAEQGHLVLEAADVPEALTQGLGARPDLVLVPGDSKGLRALSQLRANPDLGSVAAIVLTRGGDLPTLLRAFELGADDVIPQSVDRKELEWRMRARLERRATPRDELIHDPATGALTQETLARMMRVEFERVRRTRRTASFAYLALDELPTIEAELGQVARDAILAEIVDIVAADGRRVDLIGYSRNHLALVLPDTSARGARVRLHRLAQKLYHHTFVVQGSEVRLTPVIGFVVVDSTTTVPDAEERAWTALLQGAAQLDLYPVQWLPGMVGEFDPSDRGIVRRAFHRHRTALQVGAQQLLCVGLPLLAYAMLDRIGLDLTGAAYLAVVVALAFTALFIWIESIAAYRTDGPPDLPARPYPAASAIIAAYLPNEAGTIVETVRAFLRQDYPGLQIILAYNTPHDLPVEDELRAIAAEDPRLIPMRIRDSVSKAQNVNAALSRVTGEFVGVFDADHHPAQGSFKRAWRWIASGVDVVQGHCVVRNGQSGFLQRLVTSEFEAIYAVAHPGRARVHGFGIFGGSNGYWRTPLLRRTRMRGFMLTEDIDSSMRVIAGGGRIVSDPGLVSTELAPADWRGLWGQRLRWAQGWSQVSLRHIFTMVGNAHLTLRQRLGLLYLLGWREVYPWISLQAFPILAYWFLRGSPPVDWFVPIFVFTTIFTTSAGIMQTWTAWRLARPELRRQRRWFAVFALASFAFYTEYKNVMTRTAHLKEAMRERQWKVTPRTAHVSGPVAKPVIRVTPLEPEIA
jgi:cellulose synthase/poly-beta-1,6-N-acetylglucosamine synthase-like glycosyltransferase/DNA-binding response OmpR family regulator